MKDILTLGQQQKQMGGMGRLAQAGTKAEAEVLTIVITPGV